jgi:HSP20 family protein
MSLRDLTPWLGRPGSPLRAWQDNPLGSLHREVDRLFNDVLGSWERPGWPAPGEPAMMMPKLDIAETETAYEVTADLPGVEEKDVDVSLSEGVLRIKGERKSEKEEKKKNFHRVERSFGSFERAIALPEGIEADKISASFKQGVLKVTLPKTVKAKESAKRIEVKPG